jgi:hypothetical protein
VVRVVTDDRRIFVFGSNLAGRHGKGAALEAAKNYGAIRGVGWGRQGQSYAIPTKGFVLERLPLPIIEHFCRVFVEYARARPQETFRLTPIGCGLAGYTVNDIAPFFDCCPANITIPYEFHHGPFDRPLKEKNR